MCYKITLSNPNPKKILFDRNEKKYNLMQATFQNYNV